MSFAGVHALEDLCDSMGLQARGGRGEHSPPGPNGEWRYEGRKAQSPLASRLFTEEEMHCHRGRAPLSEHWPFAFFKRD